MCRLLAYATNGENRSLNDLLTPDQIEGFLRMSTIHNDGWGSAHVIDASNVAHVVDGGAAPGDTTISVYKSTESAFLDPLVEPILDLQARSGLFHLRLASSNQPLIMENQQPFSSDGIAFCHNGDISDDDGHNVIYHMDRAPVTREEMLRTGGKSDSAVYFATVLKYVDEGAALPEALSLAVRELRVNYPTSSYNCIIETADQLIFLRASREYEAYDEIRALYRLHELEEYTPIYREIRYLPLEEGGVVVASTGFDQFTSDGWRTLDNDMMLVANNRTGEFEIRPL